MSGLRTQYGAQIEELAEAARRLGTLGFVASHGGNLSYRVSEDHILITPTKVVKRKMRPDDIVVVNGEGQLVDALNGRRPTGETPMHVQIFRLRPDLNALVHAHPPILTGFSMVDTDLLQRPLLPEPVLEIGPVILIPYAEPISEALARQFDAHVHRSNAWLMQNHGITLGSSEGVERALELLEMTEAMAMSVHVASTLGPVTAIPKDEVRNMETTLATRNMPRPGDPRRVRDLVHLFYPSEPGE